MNLSKWTAEVKMNTPSRKLYICLYMLSKEQIEFHFDKTSKRM